MAGYEEQIANVAMPTLLIAITLPQCIECPKVRHHESQTPLFEHERRASSSAGTCLQLALARYCMGAIGPAIAENIRGRYDR